MKFLSYLGFGLQAFFGAKNTCRCLYGQQCWPDSSAFSELESRLSQPLIYPVPYAAACYPRSNPISPTCSDAISRQEDGVWIADQPGAYQNVNFGAYNHRNGTIEGCYLNTTLDLPCQQGSVPPIGVDARTIEDIQAVVIFAKKNGLHLVIKNTGHDFLGRSAARGGFMLWTHHLKNITYDAAFMPEGAHTNETFNAITLGAGVQWHEAYDAAQAHGRFVVGGLSRGGSVGAAGGWAMGGGHSAFAPRHGLGVDNTVQFTVVTADGNYITANAYQHTYLFWALRGGGGGSWGVVTSVTYKTHETFPLVMTTFEANFTSNNIAKTVLTEYIKLLPDLANKGWGGYSSLSNTTIRGIYIAPNMSTVDVDGTISPFFNLLRNVTGTEALSTVAYESFYSWYTQLYTPDPSRTTRSEVGHNVELGSRFISIELSRSNPQKVVDVMLAIDGGVTINFVAGGVVSQVNPDATGLNPAWREAVGHIYFVETWNSGDSGATVQAARQRIRDGVKILDHLSTDSGTYLNEASLYEVDFKKTFFGSHYERLKDIKSRYDPDSLFVVTAGVGSEEWDASLRCRL